MLTLIIVSIFLAVAVALGVTGYIPLPDAAMVLQAAVTKTADFNGAGLDLGAGYAPGGLGSPLAAVINVTAGTRADSDETYAFHLEESSDDSSYSACGPVVNVTVATTVFTTGVYVAKGLVTKRYVRLVLDVGGTTPSITYSALVGK